MLMTILMSQARLRSFILPFVLSLCLCYRVNQALTLSLFATGFAIFATGPGWVLKCVSF